MRVRRGMLVKAIVQNRRTYRVRCQFANTQLWYSTMRCVSYSKMRIPLRVVLDRHSLYKVRSFGRHVGGDEGLLEIKAGDSTLIQRALSPYGPV